MAAGSACCRPTGVNRIIPAKASCGVLIFWRGKPPTLSSGPGPRKRCAKARRDCVPRSRVRCIGRGDGHYVVCFTPKAEISVVRQSFRSNDVDQPGPLRGLYLVLDLVEGQIVILPRGRQLVPAFDRVPPFFGDTRVDRGPARPVCKNFRHRHLQSLGARCLMVTIWDFARVPRVRRFTEMANLYSAGLDRTRKQPGGLAPAGEMCGSRARIGGKSMAFPLVAD